jgi:hypothetical protein
MMNGAIVLVVVAAILLAAANHRFYKAIRRYDWQVERRLDQLHRDKANYVYVGQEKARLDFLYRALQDWVHILGEMVHRPWTTVENHYEDLPEDVIAALPASMAVARQPSGEEAVPSTVLVNALSTVYQRGWSLRQFGTAYDAWEHDQTADPKEGYRSVDLDTLESPNSPRNRLREYWESGEGRAVLTARAKKDLHSAVRDGTLVLPERVVGRIGHYSDGTTTTEPGFYEVMASENTMLAIDLFAPTARQARRYYVERSLAWMPAAARARVLGEGVEVRECAGPTAVRVDVSPRLPATGLLPFAGSGPSATTEETLSAVLDDSGEPLEIAPWH